MDPAPVGEAAVGELRDWEPGRTRTTAPRWSRATGSWTPWNRRTRSPPVPWPQQRRSRTPL